MFHCEHAARPDRGRVICPGSRFIGSWLAFGHPPSMGDAFDGLRAMVIPSAVLLFAGLFGVSNSDSARQERNNRCNKLRRLRMKLSLWSALRTLAYGFAALCFANTASPQAAPSAAILFQNVRVFNG